MCEREEGELGEKKGGGGGRGTTKTTKMEVKMFFLTRGNRWGNSGEGSVRSDTGRAPASFFFLFFLQMQ